MSQTLNASPHSLREAFYALSIAQDIPDANLLDNMVRRYPEFGQELTEFAIALAVDALRSERVTEAAEAALDPSVVSPAVSRAISHFQNRLHAVTVGARATETKPAPATSAGAANPFSALPRQEFRALAERLNANVVFVGKLRDRQIDARTMTPRFSAARGRGAGGAARGRGRAFRGQPVRAAATVLQGRRQTIGRRSADLRRGGQKFRPYRGPTTIALGALTRGRLRAHPVQGRSAP